MVPKKLNIKSIKELSKKNHSFCIFKSTHIKPRYYTGTMLFQFYPKYIKINMFEIKIRNSKTKFDAELYAYFYTHANYRERIFLSYIKNLKQITEEHALELLL